jgi:hypothetical protein
MTHTFTATKGTETEKFTLTNTTHEEKQRFFSLAKTMQEAGWTFKFNKEGNS